MKGDKLRKTHIGHGLFGLLRSRLMLVSISVIAQAVVLFLGFFWLGSIFGVVYVLGIVLSAFVALYIINSNTNPDIKIAWLVPVLLFPIFGGLAYVLFGSSRFTRRSKLQLETDEARKKQAFLTENENREKILEGHSDDIGKQSDLLHNMSGYPAFRGAETKYLKDGTVYLEQLLKELGSAKKFIFMEYFIIAEGEMWSSVLDVLTSKAKEGVEVRLIYDDIGCINRLPMDYDKYLKGFGIEACVFNPFVPVMSSAVNNRDHRKICVIDGVTAFTGGINLADEYANIIERFGRWKDTGVMLRGDSVWGFTVMFLDEWDSLHHTQENWQKYRAAAEDMPQSEPRGLIQPFCTAPFANISISESLLLSMVYSAKDHIWLTTPYLIPPSEMLAALMAAARAGVDVRIVTPRIPDKKNVFMTTRAYYRPLIDAGARVYEYVPGFIHAKQYIIDGHTAVLGSVNLDFRSLYLNFECAAYMHDTECIADMEADMLDIFAVSEEITPEFCDKLDKNIVKGLGRSILRLLAPMM